MNRLRPNPRIRPVRPYWSRTKLLTVTGLSTVAVFLAATAWLQRTEDRTVDLAPSGPYRFSSAAGPVTVANGEAPRVQYRASWLLRGPSVTEDRTNRLEGNEVVLRCDTRFPCRAGATIDVPAAAALSVEAVDNDVLVGRFDGDLTVVSVGTGDVSLGPVTGRLTVSTEDGAVHGSGLTARQVDVEARSGAIDLWFEARPERVVIKSGSEPVTLKLPDGNYAVSVQSGSSIVVAVGQATTADSEILVQARGPVRIEPTE